MLLVPHILIEFNAGQKIGLDRRLGKRKEECHIWFIQLAFLIVVRNASFGADVWSSLLQVYNNNGDYQGQPRRLHDDKDLLFSTLELYRQQHCHLRKYEILEAGYWSMRREAAEICSLEDLVLPIDIQREIDVFVKSLSLVSFCPPPPVQFLD